MVQRAITMANPKSEWLGILDADIDIEDFDEDLLGLAKTYSKDNSTRKFLDDAKAQYLEGAANRKVKALRRKSDSRKAAKAFEGVYDANVLNNRR